MAMSKKHLSLIHVARNQLGLTEEDYRAVLLNVAGVSSSRDLTDSAFEAIMEHFQRLGFKSTWKRATFGERDGMATPRQVSMIRALWADYTSGEGTDKSLGKWLENKFKVSSLRFVDADLAKKVICALRAMVKQPKKQAASQA